MARLLALFVLLVGCGGIAVVDDPGGGGGGTGVDPGCQEFERLYQEQLAKARVCSTQLSFEQCTRRVDSAIGCGCPTFVNPANDGAILALDGLLKSWRDGGCNEPPCAPPQCVETAYAFCDGQGVCTDVPQP